MGSGEMGSGEIESATENVRVRFRLAENIIFAQGFPVNAYMSALVWYDFGHSSGPATRQRGENQPF